MRLFVVVPLITLIVCCPFLCGAADDDSVANARHMVPCCGQGDGRPAAPAHCPDENLSCFCQGVVPTASPRSHAINPDLAGPLPFGSPHVSLAHAVLSGSSALHHQRDDRPTGLLTSSRDATTGRALLQNYRC
jgi:hypothetical protein